MRRLVGRTKRGRTRARREEALELEKRAVTVISSMDMLLWQKERTTHAIADAKAQNAKREHDQKIDLANLKEMQRLNAIAARRTATMEFLKADELVDLPLGERPSGEAAKH